MKSILVIGAGRSSNALINYLLSHSDKEGWRVRVADVTREQILPLLGNHPRGEALALDVNNQAALAQAVASSDVVISLLPAVLHPVVATLCVESGRHLLTASYVSEAMRALHAKAKVKDLLLLNECGLDPGIDHMSAMKILDAIRQRGDEVVSFESFTGGLITSDTDPDNPWRYKFTWNPRNVVMAGQGTAKFIQEGEYKYIPYQKLFLRTTAVDVPGVGRFEGYANRDSLQYREAYGLQAIPTLIRGTLRYEGFCKAWNVFVQLGCCDDSYTMEGVENLTHASFLAAFLPGSSALTVSERLMNYLGLAPDDHSLKCLRWSGFFDDVPIGLTAGTPAKILEHILNKRWQLKPQDKDLIVMWHRFGYRSQGTNRHVQASLVATGNSSSDTAMAQTVGLPLGIAARLLLQGKVKERGVVIPLSREWYNPILDELNTYGISMTEEES